MSSIKSRLQQARAKLLRRQSHTSSAASTTSASSIRQRNGSSLRKSISLSKLPELSAGNGPSDERDDEQRLSQSEVILRAADSGSGSRPETESSTSKDRHAHQHEASTTTATTAPSTRLPSTATQTTASSAPTSAHTSVQEVPAACPTVILEAPTPVHIPTQPPLELCAGDDLGADASAKRTVAPPKDPSDSSPRADTHADVTDIIRRQSLVASSNARAIKTLLAPDIPVALAGATGSSVPLDDLPAGTTFNASMLHRKIWVKRVNASATLVQIREDDLVDDVREMILRKYGNSLGRSFDAPDLTLRIVPRDSNAKSQERVLGPEEEMCRTLDSYYPGGQTVNEALIIDIPKSRTPKPSPRVPALYAHHDDSQHHVQTEYFPLMPITNPSPAAAAPHDPNRSALSHAPHSIAVLQTGQLPPLPSPGAGRRAHSNRPKYPRHNTASPTTLTGAVPQSATSNRPQRARHDSSASDKHSSTGNPPIPTPPAPADPIVRQTSTPPTPRISSPRPDKKRKKPKPIEAPNVLSGLLDNSVPPINVLIVEDNIINLRVLGAFMQRLKVRWQRAMNGKEAIEKWRAGGFHLVLMDIQLPIMNGLEATREIRRLERVNSIGVFSSGSSEAPNTRLEENGGLDRELKADDKLGEKGLFKSPVIIVALTASSLQSDRHEALAAGCNDFLTKPVNFVWLERKVKEWGCMQALIDFDGWRKWKDFSNDSDTTATSKLSVSTASLPSRKGKSAASPTIAATAPNSANGTPSKRDEEKKTKRKSMSVMPPPVLPEEESAASTPDVDSGDS